MRRGKHLEIKKKLSQIENLNIILKGFFNPSFLSSDARNWIRLSNSGDSMKESAKQFSKKVSNEEAEEINDIMMTLDNLTYTEYQEMDWQVAGMIREIKSNIDKGQQFANKTKSK